MCEKLTATQIQFMIHFKMTKKGYNVHLKKKKKQFEIKFQAEVILEDFNLLKILNQ